MRSRVIALLVIGLMMYGLINYLGKDANQHQQSSTSIPQIYAENIGDTEQIPFTASGTVSKEEVETGESSLREKIDEYMKAYEEKGWFSGAVLAAKGGEVIISKGYGMANYELDVPNKANTKFHLGSITKQFTAMAIMMLQERGLLNVSDTLAKYFPDYPNGKKITLHHLLIHTSGIPDYINDDSSYDKISRLYHSPNEIINRFKNKPLEFEPGERYDYSNSGYFLLSVIIEKVSGQNYYEFLEENIFKPLNMKDTGFDDTEKIVKNRAVGYRISSGKLINAEFFDRSNVMGADGLYSTVEDLYLWDRALYTDKLVSKDTLDKIFTPYPPAKNYGYGWRTTNKVEMRHGGRMSGFYNLIARNTNDESVIIILSNIQQNPLGEISRGIEAILNGKEYSLPEGLEMVEH